MSAGEERKGTRVTFLDQTGAKSVEAVIADTVSVKRILPNIITKMNLPVMGPDGQPMSYSLDHKEGGKRLREDDTLPHQRRERRAPPDRVSGDCGGLRRVKVQSPRSKVEQRCPHALTLDFRPWTLDLRWTSGYRRERNVMRESPRSRRLRSDLKALRAAGGGEHASLRLSGHGTPPDFYILRFRGRGFWKSDGPVTIRALRDEHEVHVRLGASYPRMMPELAWKSPIFHPNISASGVVCLGGYGTYWVPSLALDELCGMLWDMIRYENYDETSPYNREAAAWAKNQTQFRLPHRQPAAAKQAGEGGRSTTCCRRSTLHAGQQAQAGKSNRGSSPFRQPPEPRIAARAHAAGLADAAPLSPRPARCAVHRRGSRAGGRSSRRLATVIFCSLSEATTKRRLTKHADGPRLSRMKWISSLVFIELSAKSASCSLICNSFDSWFWFPVRR